MILCINPECGVACNKKNARGMCKKCYSQAMRLVFNGRTTWEELESLGLAAKLQTGKLAAVIEARRQEAKRGKK